MVRVILIKCYLVSARSIFGSSSSFKSFSIVEGFIACLKKILGVGLIVLSLLLMHRCMTVTISYRWKGSPFHKLSLLSLDINEFSLLLLGRNYHKSLNPNRIEHNMVDIHCED